MAVAKHHSLAVCEGGELFSWGSNRDGRLGYLGPDSQPTPRRYAAVERLKHDHIPQQGPCNRAFCRKQTRPTRRPARSKSEYLPPGRYWPCHSLSSVSAIRSLSSLRATRLVGILDTDSGVECRVTGLKGVNVASAAVANRHSVVASADGRVFSWGSNLQGQLGYGTSDSASNATPRLVEAVKARVQSCMPITSPSIRPGCQTQLRQPALLCQPARGWSCL